MTRPFVDRPVVDLDAATSLARAAAVEWGTAEPVLLRAGMNAIFRAGDLVLRVGLPSAPAHASIELAEALLERGLRVTRPAISDVISADAMSVTAWEYLTPTGRPIDWRSVGEMVRNVHQIEPDDLPEEYPLPVPANFPWWNFDALLDEVAPALDDRARVGITAAIARWSDWANPEGSVVCHGDVHPGNVVMVDTGPVLIDWDLLCWAPPGWDHAPMMTWHSHWGGHSDDYRAFAAGYGESLVGDEAADGFAELRLVAATLMRLKAGLSRPAAMGEAQRRLAYWRGESDAPAWQAQ